MKFKNFLGPRPQTPILSLLTSSHLIPVSHSLPHLVYYWTPLILFLLYIILNVLCSWQKSSYFLVCMHSLSILITAFKGFPCSSCADSRSLLFLQLCYVWNNYAQRCALQILSVRHVQKLLAKLGRHYVKKVKEALWPTEC